MRALFITVLLALLVASACGGDSGPRVRLLLQPVEGILIEDIGAALDETVSIIEQRLDGFDIGSEVERIDDNTIAVMVSSEDAEAAQRALEPTGLLQFCEPVMNEAGDVAIVRDGTVAYEPGSCKPKINVLGGFMPEGESLEVEFVSWARTGELGSEDNPRDEQIVWHLATGTIDGVELSLDSTYLLPTTSVFITGSVIKQPTLFFEFEGDGEEVLEQVTERLRERNYPIAPFLDGDPILDSTGLMIAPQVQERLTGGQVVITGLNLEAAEELSILLNTGAFPISLRIVEITEVQVALESSFFDLSFWQAFVAGLSATLIGAGVGVYLALYRDREVAVARAQTEAEAEEKIGRELRRQLLGALGEGVDKNLELIRKLTAEVQEGTVTFYNVDLTLLDSLSQEMFTSLIHIELIQAVDSLRHELHLLHREVEIHLETSYSSVRAMMGFAEDRRQLVFYIKQHLAQVEKDATSVGALIAAELVELQNPKQQQGG